MISTSARSTRLPSTDRYEFQKPIGSGGMGTVYRALDRRTNQLVAIKVLKFKFSENPTMHQRLALEFRAASGLEHPNIVRALAVENDGEISYLVYELVEAGNLGDRIEQHGRLPEDVAIRITTQIAQALHYAHERQVIHRDVKPDNILVLPNGKTKLTDFGLAKNYNDDSQDLTRPASGLGTPHFMAPEQFSDAKTADARCDVYSLAATLYNMVTGRLPFDAKTQLAILTNKELGRFPSAWSLVPGLSQRVDAAIAAALDPQPDRRPASCLEFFKLLTGRGRLKENVIVTPAPIRTPTAPSDDRRSSVRYPLRIGSYGIVNTNVHIAGDSVETWPLIVQDVSSAGIGIRLARRFESGMEMAIELVSSTGNPPQRLLIRVVRVQPESAGHWVHGCTFSNPLTENELKDLLKFA